MSSVEFLWETYKLCRVLHVSLQVTGIVRSTTAIRVGGEYVHRPFPAADSHPSHIVVP